MTSALLTVAEEVQATRSQLGGIAEAIGGFNEMTQDDPKFIPLEEYYNEKVLGKMLDEPNYNDLIFESEFSTQREREEVK